MFSKAVIAYFKSINANMTLNVDELHVNVNIEGRLLDVVLLKNESGVMNTTEQLNFLKMSFQTKMNAGTGAIFSTCHLRKMYDNQKMRFAKNSMIIIKYSPTFFLSYK